MNGQKIFNIFVYLSLQEKKLEQIRLQMVSNQFFTLHRAFQAISDGNEFITADNVSGLVNCDINVARKLIQIYSERDQDLWIFANFIEFCLPKTNQALRKQLTVKHNKELLQVDEGYVIKEHLQILIGTEIKILQQLQKYILESELNLEEMFKLISIKGIINKKSLQTFITQNEFKLSDIDDLFRRLDISNQGQVNEEQFYNLFQVDEIDQPKQIEQLNVQSQKLGWLNRKKCLYHHGDEKSKQKTLDFKLFDQKQTTLSNYQKQQLFLLLNLCKEQSQINFQVVQIRSKLEKRGISYQELFDLSMIEEIHQKLQQLLGEQFFVDLQDVQQFMKLIKLNEFNNEGVFRQDNFLRDQTIKLILMAKLGQYLKKQFHKSIIIPIRDLLGDFTQNISQSLFLSLCKRAGFQFSLEECENFFKREEWTKQEMIDFLNDY
ncbi:hypothetical protein pb186bvf_015009 [Paramecium bursaria]